MRLAYGRGTAQNVNNFIYVSFELALIICAHRHETKRETVGKCEKTQEKAKPKQSELLHFCWWQGKRWNFIWL